MDRFLHTLPQHPLAMMAHEGEKANPFAQSKQIKYFFQE